jgi:hypothetical protein
MTFVGSRQDEAPPPPKKIAIAGFHGHDIGCVMTLPLRQRRHAPPRNRPPRRRRDSRRLRNAPPDRAIVDLRCRIDPGETL